MLRSPNKQLPELKLFLQSSTIWAYDPLKLGQGTYCLVTPKPTLAEVGLRSYGAKHSRRLNKFFPNSVINASAMRKVIYKEKKPFTFNCMAGL